MIDKKTIIQFLSVLTHGPKKKFTKQTIHPRREWFIGLALFTAIVLFGGAFSFYSFTRFEDIHLTLKASTQNVETYKENTVIKALGIYGEKKKRFTQLLGDVPEKEVRQTEEVKPIEIPAQTTGGEALQNDESAPVVATSSEEVIFPVSGTEAETATSTVGLQLF
jgi:hypothetical protein